MFYFRLYFFLFIIVELTNSAAALAVELSANGSALARSGGPTEVRTIGEKLLTSDSPTLIRTLRPLEIEAKGKIGKKGSNCEPDNIAMRLKPILVKVSAQQQTVISSSRTDSQVNELAISSVPTPRFKTSSERLPYFFDSKPHQWRTQTPWHYPIHGTDVSKYQGDINWQEAKLAGISFAYIKATEGGDRFDEFFLKNWQSAAKAGIPRGAYHFYYFCRGARDQARWFINHVPVERAALPPVLDIEWNHTSPTCRFRPVATVVKREITTFLKALEKRYGKKPIIYTTVDFFDENKLSELKNFQFWLRSVAGHPSEKYGNHPWIFWQYTGTGHVPGINGNADINVFYGDNIAWQNFLNNR